MFRSYLYLFVIILFLLSIFLPHQIVLYAVGIFANLAVVISIYYARGLYLYSGIAFYIIGFILFINNDLSWYDYFLQFDSMLGILALFLFLPFLNSLILVGRYDKHLASLLQFRVNHVGDLYKRSIYTSHILGLFLNIATIPLLLQSLKSSLASFPTNFGNRFYAKVLLRGYALCLVWSPMEIMVIQSLDITGKSYFVVFPFLVLFAMIFLYLDSKIHSNKLSHTPLVQTSVSVTLDTILSKIKELFILLLVLVSAVTFLGYIFDISYLISLVLLLFPISLIWSLRLGKMKRYLVHSMNHWKFKSKGLANHFCMFISAGFFVNMLAETKLLQLLQNFFIQISEQTLLLFCFIGLYFFLISFVGFHPLVSIILLAEILQPVLLDISSISVSIVLITCSLSSVLYSPFNLSVSILASEIKVNPYRVGLWNIPFALLFIATSIFFAYTIHIIQF